MAVVLDSGYLKFELPGIKVDGEFKAGKLVRGKLVISDMQYEGTFNDESLLHGADCKITNGDVLYVGEYVDGVMKSGEKYVNNVLIEKGEYTFSGILKKPMLVKGSKFDGDITYVGYFDNQGYLIEGERYNSRRTYRYVGKFDMGVLIDGYVSRKLNGLDFEAKYKVVYDNNINVHLLEACDVRWSGRLADLHKRHLVMVCCHGVIGSYVHSFYLKYLSKFDGQTIRFLTTAMFSGLSPADTACLLFIIENLKKYTDYCGVELVPLRRSKSFV